MTKFMKLLVLSTVYLYANEADVLTATAHCDESRNCSFNVTIKHNDEGWKHYVDKYDILSPNGDVLGTRVLFHPHVNEQPFTRSISNIKIPKDIQSVTIRAHDLIHGYGGKEFTVKIR